MANHPPRRLFEFGPFSVDTQEKLLSRDGTPVPIAPRVFEVLLALIENRGRTVGKDELIERVWADTFVEVGNLNRSISTLRNLLGDDRHEPRFIKTFPKRGYRFDAEVREILEEDRPPIIETRQVRVPLAVHDDSLTANNLSISSRRRVAILLVLASGIGILAIGLSNRALIWNSESSGSVIGIPTDKKRNADAAELLRQGRELWQDRSGESLHRATIMLEQAVEADPSRALAHAALADAYAFDGQNWTRAEAAATIAIRLDPTLGEPHATIGFIRMFWEWKLTEADSHFRKAIALSPDYATGHQWYSINLMAAGKGHQALAEMRRALELEPNSLPINADLCRTFYFNRRLDDAEEQCEKTLAMDRGFLSTNLYLYEVYMAKGMYDEAVAQFFRNEELVAHYSTFPGELSRLRQAYETGGIRAYWQTRVNMLKKLASADYAIALYYARLGENFRVFQHLAKARNKRDLNYLNFLAEPVIGNCCYSDPQYAELHKDWIGNPPGNPSTSSLP